MNLIIYANLTLFVLGLLFGSFLSVLLHRTMSGKKGIIWGKSECPTCKHRLYPWDMIPLFSWLFKRGRCSYCHKEISPVYPLLELLTALLFITNFNQSIAAANFDFFRINAPLWHIVLSNILLDLNALLILSIFFSDLKKKAIPNLFLYGFIALSLPAFLLMTGPLTNNLQSVIIAIVVALTFFGGQYLLSRGKWLGSGDIYVAVGMAFLLGWPKLIVAIFLAYILGSMMMIIVLLIGKTRIKQQIPFAPFLMMGTLLALYQGNALIEWYLHYFLYIS